MPEKLNIFKTINRVFVWAILFPRLVAFDLLILLLTMITATFMFFVDIKTSSKVRGNDPFSVQVMEKVTGR